MTSRTTLISIGLILVVASIFAFARPENTVPQASIAAPVTTVATSTVPTVRTNTVATSSPIVPSTTAILVIAEKSYPIAVHENETVLGAMRELSLAGKMTFAGRDYPGLGFFIDSINGVSNAGGKYWILYVNGVSAAEGASSQKIIMGDSIEWKYEKSY